MRKIDCLAAAEPLLTVLAAWTKKGWSQIGNPCTPVPLPASWTFLHSLRNYMMISGDGHSFGADSARMVSV